MTLTPRSSKSSRRRSNSTSSRSPAGTRSANGVRASAEASQYKVTWLSLGLGLAVAAGSRAFDAVPMDGGPVLYLALEDTPRRLQTRMGKLLGGQKAPAGLTLGDRVPALSAGRQ